MGLKTNSVKTRIHRARNFLQDELREYDEGMVKNKPDIPEECDLFVKLIHDYVNERLSGRNREKFEAHIEDCPECKDFLKAYSRAITITDFLACGDLPASFQKKLKTFMLKYFEDKQ